MKKDFLRTELRKRRKKGDTAKLAAQLAPLEEQDKRVAKEHADARGLRHAIAHHEPGAIIVEGDRSSIAEDLRKQNTGVAGLEPVVIVIVCIVLAFIAFIAWQISLMP
jgi:hypothetical protein